MELKSSLILKNTPKLGARTWKKLIQKYKSAKDALEHIEEWPKIGISSKIVSSIKQKKWAKGFEKELKLLEKSNQNYILLSDDRYPKMLFEIPDPPIILYYSGNIKIISNPSIAIVGSRRTSPYTREFTFDIAKELSTLGITIVSGLAMGIDTLAHRGALQGIGSTIAVLGTGLDVNYPVKNIALKQEIEKNGLVISEFPPKTLPVSENFPIRNRIISGLSHGVIVIQAAKKSGSLITARYALEQNRQIFTIPGPLNNPMFEGNNGLLRQGAVLIRDKEDVISEIRYIGLNLKKVKNIPCNKIAGKSNSLEQLDKGTLIFYQNEISAMGLRPLEPPKIKNNKNKLIENQKEARSNQSLHKKILDFLRDMGQVGMDELCDNLEIETSKLISHLIQMEVSGEVKKTPSGKYYIP